MNKTLLILSLVLLASCGPSAEEIRQAEIKQQQIEMERQRTEKEASEKLAQEKANRIAAVTCSIMSETRNMDAAVRVREMNEARDKIGGEPFLRGDYAIKEALEWGLCQELVLNEPYDEILQSRKDLKQEIERVAAERRIAAEKRAEERRIAAEKRAEEKRIAAEKRAAEKRAEEKRIAAEKLAQEKRIAAEMQPILDSKPTVKEEFYTTGDLRSRTNYQSKNDGGEKHGLYESYYSNEQLYVIGSYKYGKKDGLWEKYNTEAKLLSTSCHDNGKKVDMSYCEQ